MTRAPILSLPDFSKTFIVECDALGVGVRCCLTSRETYNIFLVKLYMGRIFSSQHMRRKY